MHGYFKQRNIPFIDTQLSGDRGSHEGPFLVGPIFEGQNWGYPTKKKINFFCQIFRQQIDRKREKISDPFYEPFGCERSSKKCGPITNMKVSSCYTHS